MRRKSRFAIKRLGTSPPLGPPTEAEALDIIGRASTHHELRVLWRNIKDLGLLTPTVKEAAMNRSRELLPPKDVPTPQRAENN